jgi:hypothetical protein
MATWFLGPLSTAELHSVTKTKKRKIDDVLIEGRWGPSMSKLPRKEESKDDRFEEYYDDYKEPQVIPEVEDAVDSNR